MNDFKHLKNQQVRFLLIFCFVLVLINTACKPKPKPISEEEAYALLNEVILDDTLFIYDVYYRFEKLDWTDEMKQAFTTEELEFMQKQIRELHVKKVKPNKIVWFHRGYKKEDFAKLHYNPDEGFFERISFPVISPDRKKLLIHITNDCNCMLGGSGGDYLFEKKNGRWKQVREFNGWIS